MIEAIGWLVGILFAVTSLLFIMMFVMLIIVIKVGLLNDSDGKENQPEYWEALKEMREKEKRRKVMDKLKERNK